MKMKWYPFDPSNGSRQKRPPIKKWVVVMLAARPDEVIPITAERGLRCSSPEGLAIGYRKDAAGDKQSPYFVIPGIGGKVIAWCDCLPNDFDYPQANRIQGRIAR